MKYIKIAGKTFISFGGELREQYQLFDNTNFGDMPPGSKTDVGQLWHRIMLHSNIEAGAKARVFLQLSSTFRLFNPNPIVPEIDENQLSLHQAFIEYKFQKKWMLRAGRQELAYGANRMIGFREGPNTRLTFDAAVISYTSEKNKIDFLAATPVTSRQHVFDDKSFQDALFGIYATTQVIPKKFLLDHYFINFKSNRRRYNYGAGKENRRIFGLRAFSKNPKLNYELETTYQTGIFNDLAINALSLSGDVSYLLSASHSFILGIGANYITGDKDRNDRKLNTFNFLFSKPQFGLALPIGSTNIENINPYIKVSPTKNMAVFASVYFLRRQSIQDGTYSPGAEQLRPNARNRFASGRKKTGTQYAMETDYILNNNVSFSIEAAVIKAGDYIKETGNGKNIGYAAFKVDFKF